MATQKDVSVYIGRFSPFHLGHGYVLNQAIKSSKLVIMLVGSSGYARSLKNPFTFAERKKMIEDYIQSTNPEAISRVIIKPLRDYLYNDNLWIKQVQDIVKDSTKKYAISTNQILTDVSITGSNRDESTWYLSAFPQYKLDLQPEFVQLKGQSLSATSVRKILYDDASVTDRALLSTKVPQSSVQFLLDFKTTDACQLLRLENEHIIKYKKAWSVAPYAPTFLTVDAVVVQSGHILVVERAAFPGKGLWALPGGFLDQRETLVQGVVRELKEETGIKLSDSMLDSIARTAPKEIFDRPDRSSRGRTVTTAYLLKLDDTKPLAKVKGMNAPLHETGGIEIVETAKAFWLPIGEALERMDRWFEDHHAIVETLVNLPSGR